MANLQFTRDIIEDVLFRCDESTDGSSEFDDRALELINRVYKKLAAGGSELDSAVDETWWWLRSSMPGVLTLVPEKTGICEVTNNNTGVTLALAQADDLDGWFFRIEGESDVYRVSAHTGGGTAVTLDSVFTGTTAAAASYTAQKLIYDLPSGVQEIIGPMRAFRDGPREIDGIDETELNKRFPLNNRYQGTPLAFAMATQDSIRFSHCVNELTRLEFPYLRRATDLTDSGSEEPLVPLEHRAILSDWATFHLMMDKEDSRAEAVGKMAQNGLAAMVMEQRRRQTRIGKRTFGQINPRGGGAYNAEPLRTSSGRIIG